MNVLWCISLFIHVFSICLHKFIFIYITDSQLEMNSLTMGSEYVCAFTCMCVCIHY